MPNFFTNYKLVIPLFTGIGFLLGLLASFLYGNILKLVWKPEFGLDGFINVFTGFIVGAVIQQYFQRQLEFSKIEKSFVTDEIKESIKTLKSIQQEFSQLQTAPVKQESLTSLSKKFRSLSNLLHSTKEWMEVLNQHNHQITCDEIMNELIDYKVLLTGENCSDPNLALEHSKAARLYDGLNKRFYKLFITCNRM